MKSVIVKDASEFRAMIRRRLHKPKKQPCIRFAVRTPLVNCKPVKKVLPSRSSIESIGPVYDVILAADHDREEVECAPSHPLSHNYPQSF